MNNMIEALERIAAYPRSRSEEMSIGTAREIARAALASQAQQPEQDPYAYDVPTKDGTELAYAIYFTKYNNPLPEGAIPLYTSQQEPVSQWISVKDQLPPRSTDVLVYPMLSAYSHVAWHDGDCWRVTEYEKYIGEVHTALSDGLITHWMPLPPAPEVCSDGGKCGAGGYCITCPNMPAPEGGDK